MKDKKLIMPIVILSAVMLLGLPSTAKASEPGDVVVMVTEVVEAGIVGDQQQVAFWWRGDASPQWTESDRVVLDALQEAGVGAVRPTQVNISRIYRRPGLSTTNAAQLGSLLNGRRVLVGEIQYRPLPPVAPLGLRGVEVRAEVELVPAGDTEGVSLNRFSLRRQVYGDDLHDLLDDARYEAGTALGEVMGHSLQRVRGEVGRIDNEGLVAIRNVERAENLELLKRRLVEIDGVDRIVERWASDGVIALELETSGGEGMGEYALRVLENHSFDEFYIQRIEQPLADGMAEFWIEPRAGGF